MSLNRKILLILPLLALLSLNSQPLLNAHAQVTSSSPMANSKINKKPVNLSITLNEKVEIKKGSLQLIDSKGSILYRNNKDLVENVFNMPTPKTLNKGLYAIRYSALSSDGHRVTELIPFSFDFLESSSTKTLSAKLLSREKQELTLLCKCKEGLSQITLAVNAKKITATLTNQTLKAPQRVDLKYNGNSFFANLLLISKGEYKVEFEVYKDDFNIETYTGTLKVK